jgi:hypothetical protein
VDQLKRRFLFQVNRQADQSRCPPPPDGFPPHMMVYDQFADERGWTPRQVDQLTRAELFWLPVISAAKREAAETLRPKDDD